MHRRLSAYSPGQLHTATCGLWHASMSADATYGRGRKRAKPCTAGGAQKHVAGASVFKAPLFRIQGHPGQRQAGTLPRVAHGMPACQQTQPTAGAEAGWILHSRWAQEHVAGAPVHIAALPRVWATRGNARQAHCHVRRMACRHASRRSPRRGPKQAGSCTAGGLKSMSRGHLYILQLCQGSGPPGATPGRHTATCGAWHAGMPADAAHGGGRSRLDLAQPVGSTACIRGMSSTLQCICFKRGAAPACMQLVQWSSCWPGSRPCGQAAGEAGRKGKASCDH